MIQWNLAYAREIGTSHTKTGTVCQDYCAVASVTGGDGLVLLAVLSDGAGSAPHSAPAAECVCNAFLADATAFVASGASLSSLTESTIRDVWIERIRARVIELAAAEGLPPRDYASTFLGAAVADGCGVFIQIGDGAIVVSSETEVLDYSVVFWPQHGEYANTTSFLTDIDAVQEAQVEIVMTPIKRLAMFSDGLERLLLDFRNQTPSNTAIDQLLTPLKVDRPSEDLNLKLEAWLRSEPVNKRTDDDKSLILGVRKP